MIGNFGYVVKGKLAGCAHPAAGGHLRRGLRQLKEQHGIDAVVSLTESAPSSRLFEEFSIAFHHEPVADFSPPTFAQMQRIEHFVIEQVQHDRAVAVHCTAGQGRTGTVLACLLLVLGRASDAQEAIEQVRHSRPGSIETPEQEAFIEAWSRKR
ncbi:MAG: dual specificity protein phosphatase family protein [Candidatus Sumerlaeota bacterium]